MVKQPESPKGKIDFLGKSFSLTELRNLGINGQDTAELRKKILERNKESMGEEPLPMVLVAHHQIRVWRPKRNFDTKTGAFKSSEVFRVNPNNGSRDILGVKFSYSVAKGYTNFTITLNNANGKNRGRFSSGDIVEFYFKLVTEKELKGAEKPGSLFVKNKEKIDGLSLCFTGVLEKYSTNRSESGLTIEWSGSSGGYILDKKQVEASYPIKFDGVSQSGNIMCYEEVVWNLITNHTGLVMGEIDLGLDYLINSTGGKVDVNGAIDLMSSSVKQNNKARKSEPSKGFREDFLKEVEKILLRHEYCRFKEEGEAETTSEKAKKSKENNNGIHPRWSVLLEYDLLQPYFFGKTEFENPEVKKTYKYFLGGGESNNIAGLETNSTTANKRVRFKTKWALELYELQNNRVIKNAPFIATSSPIRAQFKLEKEVVNFVRMNKRVCEACAGTNGLIGAGASTLYNEVYGGELTTSTQKTAWTEKLYKLNKERKKFVQGDEKKDDAANTPNKNGNSVKEYSYWKPGTVPKVGQYIAVPASAGSKTGAKSGKKMVLGGILALDAVDGSGAPIKVMDVYTTFAYERNKDPKFSIDITANGGDSKKFVNVVINEGATPKVDGTANNVPNRVDAIAQAIENLAELSVVIPEDIDIKNTAVMPDTYKVSVDDIDGKGVWSEASLAKAPFEHNGTVLAGINKVLQKFFACVFFVDEYGIGHIRPRYKNVQSDKPSKAKTLPIWGLYAGQPIYPRLFSSQMSDNLSSCPTSVIVHGQINTSSNAVYAKVDHSLLKAMFGEKQKLVKSKQSINSKLEAKIIAKNQLLNYARKALTFATKCDLIPQLRPCHRIDVVDTVTGAIGRFVAEDVIWEYSKDTGIKMGLGLSFAELASSDAFTSAAIVMDSKTADSYDAKFQQDVHERMSLFGFPMFRATNLEEGKDKDSLNEINPEFVDKVMPEFNLGKDGGVISFIPRKGFETSEDKKNK